MSFGSGLRKDFLTPDTLAGFYQAFSLIEEFGGFIAREDELINKNHEKKKLRSKSLVWS